MVVNYQDVKDDTKEEEETEYYEWTMIPHCSSEDNKNGVTIKGDTQEYLEARDKIFDLFNKKGRKLNINNRNICVLDSGKNNSFKIDVKTPKGQSGKVNLKIYGANKAGIATFMITKMKDAELKHVKTLAFKVIRYLLDGIIDGVIKEEDLNNFIERAKNEDSPNQGRNLECGLCGLTFKTKKRHEHTYRKETQ